MKNASSLKSSIHEEAQRLGFFKMGIASARPLPSVEYFRRWLEQGFQGTMSYLKRQAPKRENPELVLGNARTILVLAMNYYAQVAPKAQLMHGRISRYAWGDDYHEIILSRLNKLLDFIKNRAPATNGICYADAGPIMEKVWGAETALGWIGKHTNLITRNLGSWFFIGAILLDLEIEIDTKEGSFCGKCNRCIRACPTGAIVAPYVLDARLCISYLTIELRGPIPHPLRSLIGNRIYGCDDCQEVCPWNRFAAPTTEKKFAPRQENLSPQLTELIQITPRNFRDRFRNSPVLRATRDGFVRNVAVALGNSHSDNAIPALEAALRDGSSLVRGHAAWALGQIANDRAFRTLKRAEIYEKTSEVLAEISLALHFIDRKK